MAYTEEQLRRRKKAEYDRALGRQRRLTDPEEFEHVFEIVQKVHERGMGCLDISEQTGVGRKLVDTIVYRPETIKHMFRDHRDRLEKLFYEDPAPGRHGALVNPDLGARRLQAMWCAGYPLTWQSQYCGCTPQHFSAIAKGATTRMHASVLLRIREMYDKLIDVDPLDMGITERAKGRAISGGLGRGFAPAHCWDDDTLDDPEAFPEWTGACGTAHGRTVHKRENIPMCDACKRSRYTEPPKAKLVLDREELERHIAAWDGTLRSLAAELGMHVDSLSGWRNGQRSPSPEALEKLAGVLGVRSEELIK